MNKQVITAFFIKDGASKLIEFAETFLNKKKNKKHSTSQEIAEYDASVMNFIILKPTRPTFNYFKKQVVNSMEGKTRSCTMFQDESSSCYKDINSFKMLYNKYLNLSQNIYYDQLQPLHLKKNIELTFGYKLFNDHFQSPQIGQNLRQISENISRIKDNIKDHPNQQLFKKIEMNGLSNRTIRLNQEYYIEQRNLVHKRYEQIFDQKSFNNHGFDQHQQYCGKIINITVNRWFGQILEAINMKDILNSPNIIVQWENSLIQKEKHQIIAQQINGKMLFQIEQKINTLKNIIKPLDALKESQLRQRKNGIHSLSFQQNSLSENEKSNIFGKFDQTRNKSGGPNTSEQVNKSYQKMANRIQNLRKSESSQINVSAIQNMPQQIVKKSNNIGKSYSFENSRQAGIMEKPSHRIAYKEKEVKPSPLRPENMSKFKLMSKSKMQKLPSNASLRNPIQSNVPNKYPHQKRNGKVQIKFPIKIQNFEMQSWTYSFLCYKSQKLNLKQLPLAFMKDRHKFGENRVKIEYPCSPEDHDRQMVCKGMQILNCLGAEVYCQEEISYKTANQIDSAEILSISWLLQRPVKEVVEYYGQFNAGCSTKK